MPIILTDEIPAAMLSYLMGKKYFKCCTATTIISLTKELD